MWLETVLPPQFPGVIGPSVPLIITEGDLSPQFLQSPVAPLSSDHRQGLVVVERPSVPLLEFITPQFAMGMSHPQFLTWPLAPGDLVPQFPLIWCANSRTASRLRFTLRADLAITLFTAR